MKCSVLLLDSDIASAFAKIDRLELLKKLFSDYEILITPEVYEEILVPIDYGYTFPAKIIEFFDIVTPSREDIKGYKKLLLDKTNLGKGEIESIVVCKNREYLFSSMDDKALKFAKGCGVKTISLHAILRSLLKSNIVKEEEAREIIKEIEEKDKTTILNQEDIFK